MRPDPPALDLILVANSPGELAGWAAPVVREVRRRVPRARILLALPPCQYAGGSERAWAASLPGSDGALRIGPLLFRGKAALSGPPSPYASRRKKPGRRAATGDGPSPTPTGVGRLVLHTGGDPVYSLLLAARLGCPADACLPRPRHARRFRRCYVPDETTAERFRSAGIPPERVRVVGHLPLSGLPAPSAGPARDFRGSPPSEPPLLALFPGSRPFEYLPALPFFLRSLRILIGSGWDLRAWVALAPHADEAALARELRAARVPFEEAPEGRLAAVLLPAPSGREIRIPLVRSGIFGQALRSDLALALPGTNNLQLAGLGLPLLCVLGTNRAEEIPLDGLRGLLLALPGLRRLKRLLIPRLLARAPFVSLPNRIAREALVPELRGYLTPEKVAEGLASLLDDPARREAMRRTFGRLFADRGAAGRVTEGLLEP